MKHAVILLAAAFMSVAGAAAKPSVVSLDYCSDQYVLMLADPDQIRAVSRGADKDYSYMRARAKAHKRIRPTAEEALALAPDLVIRQWGGGPNANAAFARFGAEVVSLGYPEDFRGVRDNVRLVAAALQQIERGEALIDAFDARLAALRAAAPSNIRALYVTPGGVTAGARTMIDAILSEAGVVNITSANGHAYWPALPAEALLLDPPQLIVAGFFISRDDDINHWSAARHPALQKQLEETPSVFLTPDLISCAGWFAIDAAETIADKAAAVK